MAVPVPSISCCVFNNNDLFYQEPNELAFNRDTCCHLVICLRLIGSHWEFVYAQIIFLVGFAGQVVLNMVLTVWLDGAGQVKISLMEQHALKIVNNCLNTNIYCYLETSDGQSSNLYLNVVHFFNASVN